MNRMRSGVGVTLGLAALVLSVGSGFAGSEGGGEGCGDCGGGTPTQVQVQSSMSVSQSAAASKAKATADNAGNQQNIIFNSPAAPTETTIKNVPNVYAPGLAAAGSEVCLGSISAGGSAAGFGLTIGGTYVDRECQLRLNARTLAVLGYPVAARETMCLDPDVRQAMLAAGTPCAADRAAYAQAADAQAAAAAYAQAAAAAAPSAAPSAAPRRAAVADPRQAMAAAPVRQPVPTAVTSDPTSELEPVCRKEYDFIRGWRMECNE